MINIGELIYDPDFCTEFKIIRKNVGTWTCGRQTEQTKILNVIGIVTSVSSKDLEMMPEGDRVHGIKTFYTDKQLRITGNESTSDICEYQGKQYRLLQVFDYNNNGFYKAIGTLIGGV